MNVSRDVLKSCPAAALKLEKVSVKTEPIDHVLKAAANQYDLKTAIESFRRDLSYTDNPNIGQLIQSLTRICAHPPSPGAELERIWPTIVELFLASDAERALWKVLSTVDTYKPNCEEARKALVDAGGIPRVLELATMFKFHLEIPFLAIRCIDFVASTPYLIQSVIDAQVRVILKAFLTEKITRTDKEIICILKRISFGSAAQAATLTKAGYIPIMTKVFSDRSLDSYPRFSALLIIGGMVNFSTEFATRELVKALCEVLSDADELIYSTSLGILDGFTLAASSEDRKTQNQNGTNEKRVAKLIMEFGFDDINKLSTYQDKHTSCHARSILKFIQAHN